MADHHPGTGGEGLSQGSLPVLFEDPFWIGLFEVADREGLRVNLLHGREKRNFDE